MDTGNSCVPEPLETRGRRSSFRPAWLVTALLLSCALGTGAMMMDDDLGGQAPPDLCLEPGAGIVAEPYVNGLPLILEELEIVGDRVKVVVDTTPVCAPVTPSSLPFSWQVIGPGGAEPLTSAATLRPHFRPTVAGAYQARITYCPQTCQNVHVGVDFLDIPPLSASVTFIVLPPATQPLLTPTARATPTPEQRATETAFHEERLRT